MNRIGKTKKGKYLGFGYCSDTNLITRINGKDIKSLVAWRSMLDRVFNKKLNCTICNEWLDFYNFDNWFNKNYYNYKEFVRLEVDKDIIKQNNKHYSPHTCLLVPQHINTLFTSCNASRGKYPKGVSYHKGDKRYRVRISMFGKTKQIGQFKTADEADIVYKEARSSYIKRVAEVEKDLIPIKLYNALLNHHEVG